MSFVYSSSILCGCGAAAVAAGLPFLVCAEAGGTERASAASAHTKRHCISDTNSAMSLWMPTWLSWTNELLAQGSDRFCARPRDPPPHGGATRVDRERAVARAAALQSGAALSDGGQAGRSVGAAPRGRPAGRKVRGSA